MIHHVEPDAMELVAVHVVETAMVIVMAHVDRDAQGNAHILARGTVPETVITTAALDAMALATRLARVVAPGTVMGVVADAMARAYQLVRASVKEHARGARVVVELAHRDVQDTVLQVAIRHVAEVVDRHAVKVVDCAQGLAQPHVEGLVANVTVHVVEKDLWQLHALTDAERFAGMHAIPAVQADALAVVVAAVMVVAPAHVHQVVLVAQEAAEVMAHP